MRLFQKQRHMMSEYQTPEVEHEENWIQFVMLAYVQLWAARHLSQYLPRPCSRYLEQNNDKIITPSVVQRDFQRIISQIGTPASSPKTRGNSIGRVRGQTQTKRTLASRDEKAVKINTEQTKSCINFLRF